MYLTTQDVARRLGVASATVRQLANSGKLPTMRTYGGQRLFKDCDVEQLARERREKAATQTGGQR